MGAQQSVETKSGWLSSTFGCCAPTFQHDEDSESLRGNNLTQSSMIACSEQPQPIPFPTFEPATRRPSTSLATYSFSQWTATGRDFIQRVSSPASFSISIRPWTSYSQRRPSISEPTHFRRFEEEEPVLVQRRASFRPLELSIYLPDGRLSPLPDFSANWDSRPPELKYPDQALISLRTDSFSSDISNSFRIPRKPVTSISGHLPGDVGRNNIHTDSKTAPLTAQGTSLQQPGENLRPNSLNCPITQPAPSPLQHQPPRSPSPTRTRANIEPTLLHRRSSSRRTKPGVDEAIRELNTIVEERRADAFRASGSPIPSSSAATQLGEPHIPAVAPSMRVRVRTETLSDIGSAFSVPLTSKPLPEPPASPVVEATSSVFAAKKRTKFSVFPVDDSRSSSSASFLPTSPSTSQFRRRARDRLASWLHRSLPSSPTTSHPTMPFYQCAAPPRGSGGTNASISTVESVPSLTETTTSPTSDPLMPKRPRGRSVASKAGSTTMTAAPMTLPPPAYQELDPHPNSPTSPVFGVGLAF